MRTGKAYYKVMNSHVVGIGGYSTGLDFFTIKNIPKGTLVCAYAQNGIYEEMAFFKKKLICSLPPFFFSF